MKRKIEIRATSFDYWDIDKRLSEIHDLAVNARDSAQAVLDMIGAYKDDLLSARVKYLKDKLGEGA